MACSAEISHFREHGGRDAARWISRGRGALDLASSPFAPLRRFADGWFTCPFSFRKPRFLIVSPTQSPAYSPSSPASVSRVSKTFFEPLSLDAPPENARSLFCSLTDTARRTCLRVHATFARVQTDLSGRSAAWVAYETVAAHGCAGGQIVGRPSGVVSRAHGSRFCRCFTRLPETRHFPPCIPNSPPLPPRSSPAYSPTLAPAL